VEVRVSHRFNPRKWRRLDVLMTLSDRKVAMEIQLWPIFLSTIVGRDNFCRENDIILLWILPTFSPEKNSQTFTSKDICYNHRHNVFVLDAEAQQISKDKNELFLMCHYRRFALIGQTIGSHWEKKIVAIGELNFDRELGIYYYDSEGERQRLLHSINYDETV